MKNKWPLILGLVLLGCSIFIQYRMFQIYKVINLLPQEDKRAEPIKRIVALGESTTWGYSVTSKEKSWINQTVALIEEFQGQSIELINQGIGFNVLTPKCPGYPKSAKPSALERLNQDVLALDPDMIILSYGLNDSRGGISPEIFRQEYQKLIDQIRKKSEAMIVILNVYYMHEVAYRIGWDRSNYYITEKFNKVIAELAKKNDLILANVWEAEKGVDWLVDDDHVHPNDLGHRIIAHRVFEAIVRNCSFVSRTLPQESQFRPFITKYGNGPERPGGK